MLECSNASWSLKNVESLRQKDVLPYLLHAGGTSSFRPPGAGNRSKNLHHPITSFVSLEEIRAGHNISIFTPNCRFRHVDPDTMHNSEENPPLSLLQYENDFIIPFA